MRDIVYPPTILLGKAAFKGLGIKWDIQGAENIPQTGGALLAINHVSYLDWLFVGYAAQASKRLVRFMAKKEVFAHPVAGPLMRGFHHIPVDRDAGAGSAREAVRYLREGEIVGTFPEATISRSLQIKELKSGAARIAHDAGVPLLPTIIWGTQRFFTKDHPKDFGRKRTIAVRIGTPLALTGDAGVDTKNLQIEMEHLLDQTIRTYPSEEQPPGSWWLPAAYGGSAPTPERATQLDSDELRARIAARRAKAAKKKG